MVVEDRRQLSPEHLPTRKYTTQGKELERRKMRTSGEQ